MQLYFYMVNQASIVQLSLFIQFLFLDSFVSLNSLFTINSGVSLQETGLFYLGWLGQIWQNPSYCNLSDGFCFDFFFARLMMVCFTHSDSCGDRVPNGKPKLEMNFRPFLRSLWMKSWESNTHLANEQLSSQSSIYFWLTCNTHSP